MKEGPLILAMDTATKCSAVALTQGTLLDGNILASISLNSDVTHSRRLIASVELLFEKTGVSWSDISGIGVGLGPGSFTGLRIGMATAKGFASASGIRLLGVSTLDVLATSCLTEMKICVVLDARKKQVYTAMYRHSKAGTLQRESDIKVVEPSQLTATIDEPVLMIGDGVPTYRDYWKNCLGDRVVFAPEQLNSPSATSLGLLCGLAHENGEFLETAKAVPLYVRASDAELSLGKRGSAKKKKK